MNIAIFTNNYKPFIGGVETSIESFKTAMEKQGHDVYVFAPKYPGYKDEERGIIRLLSIEAPTYEGYQLPISFLPKIEKEFKKLDIDIVHVQHPLLMGDAGLKIGRKYNLPVVFTYHTIYEEYLHYIPLQKDISKAVLEKLMKSFCNQCDLVISPSEYVKKSIENKGIETKIKVIPTGVEISKYVEHSPGKIRERYYIPKNTKILLYTGRLAKEKNLDFLLDCMAGVVMQEPDTICLLAGAGDEREKLEEKVKTYNMSHKIIFTGKIDRDSIIDFYIDSDIFLFSSKTETQGLVVLEAMAAGTPVIAVEGPGVNEFLDDGKNGYLVKEEKNEFIRKTIELLKDNDKRKEFSKYALKTAENNSIERLSREMISEYKVLKNGPVKEGYQEFRYLKSISEVDWMKIIKIMIKKGNKHFT